MWTRGSRRAMCHTSSVSFSARNNLFRFNISFIYLKWTFFKYLKIFGIFLKISFSGSIDSRRLEFRENSTISKFNEIRLDDYILQEKSNGQVRFVIRDL